MNVCRNKMYNSTDGKKTEIQCSKVHTALSTRWDSTTEIVQRYSKFFNLDVYSI